MRYLLRQKYLSVRDKYTIKDENGNDRFLVTGKFISIGKKLSLSHLNGQQIYFIKQKIFALFPKFVIEQNGQEVGTFKAQFSLFRKRAKITSSFGDFKMQGSVMAWDFTIESQQNIAMNISKKILRIADTYTVDIARGLNDDFMLCIAVIIDAIYQRRH